MRIGSTRRTVTGTTLSSTHVCVMPTFSPTIDCCAMAAFPLELIEPHTRWWTAIHANAPPSLFAERSFDEHGRAEHDVMCSPCGSGPDVAGGLHGHRLL